MTTQARSIICLNTNEIFKSISKASKKLNIPYSSIYDVVNGNYRHTTHGYVFEFYDPSKDYNEDKERIKKALQKRAAAYQNSKIQIKCLNNDITYDSISEAAKLLNISSTMIINCIKGISKPRNGLRFKKVINGVVQELPTKPAKPKKVYCKNSSIAKPKQKKLPELNYNGMRYD